MLKMLDLFSGIGGFPLAADWTGGIETVAFCEIEPFCQNVLKKHWPDVPIFSDIKELKGERIESVDIISGGFPCQPFSVAGKRRSQGDDRHLWPEMFRVIQECKPTWVIGENVTGLIELALEDCFVDLEAEGYEVQPLIIPACAVNAPHRRDRVWIIAYATQERLQRISEKSFSRLSNISKQFHRSDTDWRDGWDISKPLVYRTGHGIPDWMDRIGALGNSIVPQVAYQILQGIVDIEIGGNSCR
jgi:DNA (cytosine-5)-methyltransferase 1